LTLTRRGRYTKVEVELNPMGPMDLSASRKDSHLGTVEELLRITNSRGEIFVGLRSEILKTIGRQPHRTIYDD